MSIKASSKKRILFFLIPFIIATLIMMPRLLSAQFGIFDDIQMVKQSRAFLEGDFSMSNERQGGRFRPAYWLYYALIYLIVGYNPFWFFIGHLIILFILLYELRLILEDAGFSDPQILTSSIIFLFTMPIIENFYTLSKGEPFQLVFILAGVLILSKRKYQHKYDLKRMLLSALCILIAILFKENAMVTVPIFFLWAVNNYFSPEPDSKKGLITSISLSSAAILAVVTYFLLRRAWGATALLGGTYTGRYLFDIPTLIQKFLRWATQFAFHFHYLLPIILMIIFLFFSKNTLNKKEKRLVFQWGIWCLVWYGFLIPWQFAEVYFLLSFGFGVSIIIGIIIPPILRSIMSEQKYKRFSVAILLFITIILFILTIPNYITHAKTQLTFDKVNQEMLNFISEYPSADSTIFVNIETSNEYSEILEVFLKEINQFEDVTYDNIDPELMEEINNRKGAIILMPFIKNQPNLTVRAGVEEFYQQQWNERFLEKTGSNRESVTRFEQSFQLSNVNLPVLLCPLLGQRGFCKNPDPFIDTRLFTYGWEIFEIR
jgi:hypothetical protein